MLTQNELMLKYMLKMRCGFHTTTGFAEAQWFYVAAYSEHLLHFLEFVTYYRLLTQVLINIVPAYDNSI